MSNFPINDKCSVIWEGGYYMKFSKNVNIFVSDYATVVLVLF